MKSSRWQILLLFIVICETLGYLSFAMSGNIAAAYAAYKPPPLSPDAIVFRIVWPALYCDIAVSGYLVYITRNSEKYGALFWFICALLLNFLWSPVFFGLSRAWAAFVIVIILDIAAIYVACMFYRIRRSAGWLMLPYVIWLLFSSYLNLGFALLN